MDNQRDNVTGEIENNFDMYLDDLRELVMVPSISFPGFPEQELKKCANAVAALLQKRGLQNVKTLSVENAQPYVYGDWLNAPGKPTLLLYANYDVQPAGRDELWLSPPFQTSIRPGPAGDRIYGRGTADDKAGIVIHTTAISAFLSMTGKLPINVKVIIEGEEETGSAHLPLFLKEYKNLLGADAMVLTDTSNFDSGVPALTVALRGIVGIEVEVRALTKTIHSGMWGGPVPDPAIALSKMLSTLVDGDGQIAVPGVLDDVRPLTKSEVAELNRIPFDEAEFRKQAGLVPGARLLGGAQSGCLNPLVQIWRQPSLTVNAIQASSRKQAANIINDIAWAKVTVRLVPDMDPAKICKQLEAFLRKIAPWGVEVGVHVEAASPAWSVKPDGPVFEAAEAAMLKGYGVKPHKIGCGGSIPFAKPFSEALGGVPALLIGVEDPHTNAHGENESLLLSDFKKACLSQAYLFEELSKRLAR
ncbi:MAG: M20/M25/M40 family metallo-hydrolase [Bdellovibrionota bacterium]